MQVKHRTLSRVNSAWNSKLFTYGNAKMHGKLESNLYRHYSIVGVSTACPNLTKEDSLVCFVTKCQRQQAWTNILLTELRRMCDVFVRSQLGNNNTWIFIVSSRLNTKVSWIIPFELEVIEFHLGRRNINVKQNWQISGIQKYSANSIHEDLCHRIERSWCA